MAFDCPLACDFFLPSQLALAGTDVMQSLFTVTGKRETAKTPFHATLAIHPTSLVMSLGDLAASGEYTERFGSCLATTVRIGMPIGTSTSYLTATRCGGEETDPV